VTVAEPALLVLAWGNESRGDDGAGPLLARRIGALHNPRIRVIEDLQLHIEHVMDLHSDVPVLFIDASVGIDRDFELGEVSAVADNSFSTHTVSPECLLHLFEHTMTCRAPAAYLLQVAGRTFELGESLSADTAQYVEDAWAYLLATLQRPAAEWQSAFAADAGHSAGRTPELVSGAAPLRR